MGKSYTPTYRVEYRDQTGLHSECWKGRATAQRLEAWRQARNTSLGHGGVNYHLSLAVGLIVHVSWARLIRQSTREVVAEVRQPLFEAV